MHIKDVTFYTYTIPYKKALMMKDKVTHYRAGIFIELFLYDNTSVFGEIAPFPGLHNESIEHILGLKSQIISSIANGELLSFEYLQALPLPPSVIHGISQALDISVMSQNVQEKTLTICPLISGTSNEMLEEIHTLTDNKNVRSIKVKFGRQTVRQEIELFHAINELLPPHIKLRIDVNRKWTLAQAIEFGSNVLPHRIEYIEEPLQNPHDLDNFFDKTAIQYALDETIYEVDNFETLQDFRSTQYYIIKPSLLKGKAALYTLKDIADRNHSTLIFSSAFESTYSLAYYGYLASTYADIHAAQGFDTYKWFRSDVLQQPLQIENYTMNLREALKILNTDNVNRNLLEAVT
jgi:o-succinylbenzoate synthase